MNMRAVALVAAFNEARTIAAVVEASDQPDDLSGYRETPARRVLLVEGRQACYGDRGAFESVGSEW